MGPKRARDGGDSDCEVVGDNRFVRPAFQLEALLGQQPSTSRPAPKMMPNNRDQKPSTTSGSLGSTSSIVASGPDIMPSRFRSSDEDSPEDKAGQKESKSKGKSKKEDKKEKKKKSEADSDHEPLNPDEDDDDDEDRDSSGFENLQGLDSLLGGKENPDTSLKPKKKPAASKGGAKKPTKKPAKKPDLDGDIFKSLDEVEAKLPFHYMIEGAVAKGLERDGTPDEQPNPVAPNAECPHAGDVEDSCSKRSMTSLPDNQMGEYTEYKEWRRGKSHWALDNPEPVLEAVPQDPYQEPQPLWSGMEVASQRHAEDGEEGASQAVDGGCDEAAEEDSLNATTPSKFGSPVSLRRVLASPARERYLKFLAEKAEKAQAEEEKQVEMGGAEEEEQVEMGRAEDEEQVEMGRAEDEEQVEKGLAELADQKKEAAEEAAEPKDVTQKQKEKKEKKEKKRKRDRSPTFPKRRSPDGPRRAAPKPKAQPKGKAHPKGKASPKPAAKEKTKPAKSRASPKSKACEKGSKDAVADDPAPSLGDAGGETPAASKRPRRTDPILKKMHSVYSGAHTSAKNMGKSPNTSKKLANKARQEWVIKEGPRDHPTVKRYLEDYSEQL